MAIGTERDVHGLSPQQVADRLIGVLNSAGLALMLSVGHRTRLFDVMAELPRSSAGAIAEAAGLQERYVREWLGAMVTGQIVTYDPLDQTYALPAEYAAFLTRAAVPNNLASVMQWTAVLGQVEDQIVERFQSGGGVPYSCFCRFHEVMAEESNQSTIYGLLDHILPLAPGLLDRLRAGIDVLDVGCGAGRAMLHLAENFPASRFVGVDFSDEAIGKARAAAASRRLTNVHFEVRDAAALNQTAAFDLVTAFDAIHDQAQPAAVLQQIYTALRPGGTFLMQDIAGSSYVEKNIGAPLAPFLYTISCMHCMTVSLASGGAGLGAMWGEELALQMLQTAGFPETQVRRLPHDILNSYYISQR